MARFEEYTPEISDGYLDTHNIPRLSERSCLFQSIIFESPCVNFLPNIPPLPKNTQPNNKKKTLEDCPEKGSKGLCFPFAMQFLMVNLAVRDRRDS